MKCALSPSDSCSANDSAPDTNPSNRKVDRHEALRRKRMEKTPRYTQRERNMVLGFAAQYRDVIENKRTDAESNRKKDDVWRLIAKEFNARVYHQRTSKQLRQLYKNMKLLLKKDLCTDGKSTKSFIEILTAVSQQNSVSQYLSSGSPTHGSSYSNRHARDLDTDKVTSFSHPNDNDVVVIKSEDVSDNDQTSSIRNDMELDDDDDCLSSKDIPEVCLEEEDDDIFDSTPPDLLISMHANGKSSNEQSSTSKNDFLLVLAIEERKRKIDLLNAQIEYWKTLTKKLEANSGSGSTPNATSTPMCHCHMPPRMNGVNQS